MDLKLFSQLFTGFGNSFAKQKSASRLTAGGFSSQVGSVPPATSEEIWGKFDVPITLERPSVKDCLKIHSHSKFMSVSQRRSCSDEGHVAETCRTYNRRQCCQKGNISLVYQWLKTTDFWGKLLYASNLHSDVAQDHLHNNNPLSLTVDVLAYHSFTIKRVTLWKTVFFSDFYGVVQLHWSDN